MATLFLGSYDTGKRPLSRKDYLKPYHIDGLLLHKVSFRDDDRTKWRSFREVSGANVRSLQQFLLQAGFMPRASLDGVFGYVTQAAVRLFQEYVRTIDGVTTMIPDGFVGKTTLQHMDRWKQEGKVSEWGKASSNTPTLAYSDWMTLLGKAKKHYLAKPGPIVQKLNATSHTGSTKKTADWTFDPNAIHLIGVRRNQTTRVHTRTNDDLFFLLINGMVFTFWGSTDASASMANRAHEAFLIEGQHVYRFGWHKITNEKKIYRALKPQHASGVAIVRDWDNDNALTNSDLQVVNVNGNKKNLEINNSINIHWTGVGTANFSAGCQVIAGKSYLNHHGTLQDCSHFASKSYAGLSNAKKKTKGAYNVFTDLLLCYAKEGVQELYYTLGRQESLALDTNFGVDYADKAITKLKAI